jgi:hypothetical protein
LDGKTVAEVSSALRLPFQVVSDSYSARELVDHILSNVSACHCEEARRADAAI